MGILRALVAILARIFLSIGFLVSGIYQILYWKNVEKQLISVFGEWQIHTTTWQGFQGFFNGAVVWLPVILMVLTFLEILGALLLLFGIKEKLGAFFLILVLVPSTILMQHFWFLEGTEKTLAISAFLKNLAILGGLLIVILHGAHGREREYPEDY